MDIEKYWNKALKHTEIIRARIQALMTHSDTNVPYILLSESTINIGDTIVRKGEIIVQKPALIVPPNNPLFNGFEFSKENEDENVDHNSLVNFLLVRGISLPSLKYDNQTNALDIYEGKLSEAISHYQEDLQRKENIQTGLLIGPEDCWQFSLLIFICAQVSKNADTDIRKLFNDQRHLNN